MCNFKLLRTNYEWVIKEIAKYIIDYKLHHPWNKINITTDESTETFFLTDKETPTFFPNTSALLEEYSPDFTYFI
ncbi:6746_t:CDS:2 [Acaulospora colombiana]|uniref:6746_t:CDS:1 n=1 Tax=Acaulospora colombiana TaxID=27376 RepID=A0ACA9L1Z3_9GLOM|nr:6746_t:CDS:2 [Acaulospora colombiana]